MARNTPSFSTRTLFDKLSGTVRGEFTDGSGILSTDIPSLSLFPIPWNSQTTGGALSPQDLRRFCGVGLPTPGQLCVNTAAVGIHARWDGSSITNWKVAGEITHRAVGSRPGETLPLLSEWPRWGSGVVRRMAHSGYWRKRRKGRAFSSYLRLFRWY